MTTLVKAMAAENGIIYKTVSLQYTQRAYTAGREIEEGRKAVCHSSCKEVDPRSYSFTQKELRRAIATAIAMAMAVIRQCVYR